MDSGSTDMLAMMQHHHDLDFGDSSEGQQHQHQHVAPRAFASIRPDPTAGVATLLNDDDVETEPRKISDKEVDTYKEQDRFLPIANVGRIMKKCLPTTTKVSKDAKECVQECTSEFISFITSEAAERCLHEKRKTINGEDILFAMTTLGFENYADTLKIYLAKYREHQRTTGRRANKKMKLEHAQQQDSDAVGSYPTYAGDEEEGEDDDEDEEEEEDDDERDQDLEGEDGNEGVMSQGLRGHEGLEGPLEIDRIQSLAPPPPPPPPPDLHQFFDGGSLPVSMESMGMPLPLSMPEFVNDDDEDDEEEDEEEDDEGR